MGDLIMVAEVAQRLDNLSDTGFVIGPQKGCANRDNQVLADM